jgi:hypothetical protein
MTNSMTISSYGNRRKTRESHEPETSGRQNAGVETFLAWAGEPQAGSNGRYDARTKTEGHGRRHNP